MLLNYGKVENKQHIPSAKLMIIISVWYVMLAKSALASYLRANLAVGDFFLGMELWK